MVDKSLLQNDRILAEMVRRLVAAFLPDHIYKGESVSFDMPGWYCDDCEESIHTGKDMKVSDRMVESPKGA